MLAAFLDDIRDGDLIAPKRMADRLRLPMTRLSRLAHLNRNTMLSRPDSPAVQEKLGADNVDISVIGAVPEPATWLLVAVGLVAVGGMSRRRLA